jgi:signal transduction histidine kinase
MCPSPASSDPKDSVAALVAVTECETSLVAAHDGLDALTEAAVAALGGSAGGLWVEDVRIARRNLQASVGLAPPEAGDPSAGIADATYARVVEAGDETALGGEEVPSGMRRVGASHAMAFPVCVAGEIGGVFVVGASEPLAADGLRHHAAKVAAARMGSLLEGIRLRDNLERAMAQILETDERMLGRMGLDIHDGPTQQLSVALLEVQLLDVELADGEAAGAELPASVRPALSRIYETLGGALHEMRELIGHLRPAQFDDRRLSDIMRDAITGFEMRTECTVDARFEGEFPVNGVSVTQRITFYRILQEALANAQRHGGATQIAVTCTDGPAGVSLEVRDNGRGFDPQNLPKLKEGIPLARFGLHGMRDRAQVLGGNFSIWSAPGAGALLRVFLPRWSPDPVEELADRR